jgi:hypothetical protein
MKQFAKSSKLLSRKVIRPAALLAALAATSMAYSCHKRPPPAPAPAPAPSPGPGPSPRPCIMLPGGA